MIIIRKNEYGTFVKPENSEEEKRLMMETIYVGKGEFWIKAEYEAEVKIDPPSYVNTNGFRVN